jgi:copper chaperone CopZ
VRKFLTVGLTALAFMALVAADVSSCGAEKASGKSCGSAEMTKSKTCSMDKTAMTGAKGCCSRSKKATTGTQSTAEAASEHCKSEGKCEHKTLSIKGMTCEKCERTVTTALSQVPGVIKVTYVSYEEGIANVCVEPAKISEEALTTAVVNKGFEAEIIPAVAKTTGAEAPSGHGGKSSCGLSEKPSTKNKAEGSK